MAGAFGADLRLSAWGPEDRPKRSGEAKAHYLLVRKDHMGGQKAGVHEADE
jgi:hypothetical protein